MTGSVILLGVIGDGTILVKNEVKLKARGCLIHKNMPIKREKKHHLQQYVLLNPMKINYNRWKYNTYSYKMNHKGMETLNDQITLKITNNIIAVRVS